MSKFLVSKNSLKAILKIRKIDFSIITKLIVKQVLVFLLLVTPTIYLNAQTMDTVRIVTYTNRKFRSKDHFLMLFEKLDSIDGSGRKITFSRSYYFDKRQRMISSVREYYDVYKPNNGIQIIYTYNNNHLVRVTFVPPKPTCSNCQSDYYYAGDSLVSKKEGTFINADPGKFIESSRLFQQKLPHNLPWGYFDDEVIVDSRMKKHKRSY